LTNSLNLKNLFQLKSNLSNAAIKNNNKTGTINISTSKWRSDHKLFYLFIANLKYVSDN